MEEIRNWILNIAVIAVLMIILDLLMPEGKMKNFTQLAAGFAVMFAMINPVLQLINKGTPVPYAGWSDEFYLLNTRFRYTTESLREEHQRQVLELYRNMLIADITNRLESNKQVIKAEVDAVLNENTSSEKFGEIRKLYIKLFIENSEGNSIPDKQRITQEIRKELKQALSIEEDKIIIHITEGN